MKTNHEKYFIMKLMRFFNEYVKIKGATLTHFHLCSYKAEGVCAITEVMPHTLFGDITIAGSLA